MKLVLVSFPTCPYVQRAEIVLHEKGVPHETRYVELEHKPDWFLELSPRGKVPVLLVDGTPLFESGAICEYLDEVCPPPRLLSEDPLLRARERGWFQFAEDVLSPLYRLMQAREKAEHDGARVDLSRALGRLDLEMSRRDYLSGDGSRFGLADVGIAPAFARMAVLEKLDSSSLPEGAALRAWMGRVLARESVKMSGPRDFEERVLAALRARGALIATAQGKSV